MLEQKQDKYLVAQNQNTLKRCSEVTPVVILSITTDYASNNSTQKLFKLIRTAENEH